MAVCTGCGGPLKPSTRKPRKWCSEACRVRSYGHYPSNEHTPVIDCAVTFRTCPVCGKVFQAQKARGAPRAACTDECRRVWRRRKPT